MDRARVPLGDREGDVAERVHAPVVVLRGADDQRVLRVELGRRAAVAVLREEGGPSQRHHGVDVPIGQVGRSEARADHVERCLGARIAEMRQREQLLGRPAPDHPVRLQQLEQDQGRRGLPGEVHAHERAAGPRAVERLGVLPVSSARAAPGQRRDGGGDGRRDRRRGAGGDDGGGRGVSRPRARDGARRRDRRRAVRQRLEGDQRRVGAAIDRELRPRARADHRRPVQGRRSRAAARAAAARARRRSSRSAKRGRCVREALAGRRAGARRRRRSTRRSRRAFALAKPAGVVLLAPACASFDMFRDYAERGRTFKEEVTDGWSRCDAQAQSRP